MNQGIYSNKPPCGGYHKALVNVKDASCSLMMVSPTEKWGKLPSHGLMFCQTSTQEFRQTKPINNSARKVDAITMHVGDTILDDAVEDGIDEIGAFSTTS